MTKKTAEKVRKMLLIEDIEEAISKLEKYEEGYRSDGLFALENAMRYIKGEKYYV